MASSIVSSTTRLLSKLLVEEAKLLYGVRDKVEALHDELTWMQVFLRDADTREDREEIIRLWVSQIRNFAYEAEDIVETYLHKVSRHRQDGFLNTLMWFSCIFSDIWTVHGVGSDIDCLNLKISHLSAKMQFFGIRPTSLRSLSHKKIVNDLRRTSSSINREEIVGLEEDTEILVGKLTNSAHKVVCISGMGGLGKSTLARMVNEGIKGQFKNRVWVYVSQQFQTRSILEDILRKLMYIDKFSRNIMNLRVDELSEEVHALLERKKCLVVLDDIWGLDAWAELAPALAPNPRSESKLLLTTRNTQLLSNVDPEGCNHLAKSLTDQESWELLNKIITSRNVASELEREMEVLGREMARYCSGLPLAVVILGGILATKNSMEEWKVVRANIHTCLQNGTGEDNLSIAQVLELSYDDLPYYLKPCFLHLGNFPEDYEIFTKTLYHMWATEGIVAQYVATEQVPLEAIAKDYLQELANRCLVKVYRTGKDGKIKSIRLHDLIRDMCLKISNEESFLQVIEHGVREKKSAGRNSSYLSNQRFHRLVVYLHESSDSLQDLIPVDRSHHVRSLLFFPTGRVPRKLAWTKVKVFQSLRLIRVLHFDNVCIRELPDGIKSLIHLRYLSLKGTRVGRLPSSVGNLKYLQILDIRVANCINMTIPNVLWKLENLKHLYLPNKWVRKDVRIRLRGLIELETLHNIRLEECLVRDLPSLLKLGKVKLADYSVTEAESLNSFVEMYNSTAALYKRPLSLTLDGDVLSKDPSILLSASQFQFHKLDISGKIWTRLRDARIFPQNVKHLVLNQSMLEDDPMPYLEILSHLTELTLGDMAFMGTEMVCTTGKFPQLAILKLVQQPNLELWTVGEGAMPSLKSLYIYSCKKLGIVPAGLPSGVKIGCRSCVARSVNYGSCCYMTPQAPARF